MRTVIFSKADSAVSEVIGFILVFAMITSIFSATVAVYVPAKAASSELGYQSSTSSAMSKELSNILNGNLPLNGTPDTVSFPMGIPGVFFSQALQTTVGLSKLGATSELSYNASVAYDYPSSTPISLINNTVSASIYIGGNPVGIALDTYNENLYAITSGNTNLYEISSNNSSSVTQISGVLLPGQFPVGITFDPQNYMIYITVQSSNASLNGIVMYNTISNGVSRIGLPNIPYDLAYDSSNGNIYVTTYYNGSHKQNAAGQVYALNPESGSIISEIDIPLSTPVKGATIVSVRPTGISYDPSNGLLYVSMHNGTNLTVINPVINQIVLYLPIQSSTDTVFDSANGTIYVTQSQLVLKNGKSHSNSQSSSIVSNYSLINGVDNKIIREDPFFPKNGCPTSEVYDTSNHLIYMAGSKSNTVTLFDGENNSLIPKTIAVGSSPGLGPNSMIFDPYNGFIYVANFGSGNISVINGHTVTIQSLNPTKSGLPTTDTLSAYGEFYATGPTQFVQPVYFVMSDGMIAAENSNNHSIGNLYGLPINIFKIGNGFALSSTLMNISGSSMSLGSAQPVYISFSVSRSQQLNLTVGQEFSLGTYSTRNAQGIVTATVDSIILNNFRYTINSTYSRLIDNYLYSKYNGATTGGAPLSWQFPNLPLYVTLNGNVLAIKLVSKFDLQTLSVKYYSIGISL